MKAIIPLAAVLLTAGCATEKSPTLIGELYSHGCDVSSYESNDRLGSVRVTCQHAAQEEDRGGYSRTAAMR